MSSVSTVPSVYVSSKAVEAMNAAVQMGKRVERGRQLFLLSMAEFVRDAVQRRAPSIDIGGESVDYAKDLRIAIISGVDDDMDAVAVYFESSTTVLNESRMDNTVLFFRGGPGSPKWVDVLSRFSPWPASIVPVKVESGDCRVVSRIARPDEIEALTKRIYARRKEIASDLAMAGAESPRIEHGEMAMGIVMHEDVGYNVLRKEFGLDGSRQEAHWRPALREIRNAIPQVMRMFVRYLETGNENSFDIPRRVFEVSESKMSGASRFQHELAPFAPTGG